MNDGVTLLTSIPCGHAEYVDGCPTCRWRLDPTEKGQAARRLWNLPEPDDPRPVTVDPGFRRPKPICPHLWRRARDEKGGVKTAVCGPCGGKEAEVFLCRCPARVKGPDKPDEVTLADCNVCDWRPRPAMSEARKLILKNFLSPGDVLVMTAAIHSLHKAHPGKFRIAVETAADAFFENSPDVEPLAKAKEEKWEEVQVHYPLIQQCNQVAVHFLHGYCQFLEDNLQCRVPLATNRPMVWLSAQEKSWLNQVEQEFGYKGRFWLVNAFTKLDFTCKQYPYYQEVIDRLQGKVMFVQVGASEHPHKPLRGVLSLIGKTDLRQLVRLVHHADGVLCGTTMLMHLAAALEKPAVILAGGREPRTWNTYPLQTLLSTVGALPCCAKSACWKSRTLRLNDGAEQDNSLCDRPVFTDPPAPKCMAIISAAEVALNVERYTMGS